MDVAIVTFAAGQLIALVALLLGLRRERLHRTLELVMGNVNEVLSDAKWLASRNPVTEPSQPNEIDTNEYLDRTWLLKQRLRHLGVIVRLASEDAVLAKKTALLDDLSDKGYELISGRDATGMNLLKTAAERYQVVLFQIASRVPGVPNRSKLQRDIRSELLRIAESYRTYIPEEQLRALCQP